MIPLGGKGFESGQDQRPADTSLRPQRGYTLLELGLYILIVTALALAVMRSVKPQTQVSNNTVEVLLGGLDKLMVAHQLTSPSCLNLVNDSAMTRADYKSAAQWCWLFPAGYNPTTRATWYPARALSDFWGTGNGRDTGAGQYLTQSGIPLQIFYNDSGVAVITMQIQISLDQIKAMGYDNCYSLISGLYDRLVAPGFAMQFATGRDGAKTYGKNSLPGAIAPLSKPVSVLSNYCNVPVLNTTTINVYLSPLGTP